MSEADRHEYSLLAGFFDAMSEPAAILDGEFSFQRVNPAFERYLGYMAAEVAGQSVLKVFDPALVDTVRSNCDLLERLKDPRLRAERQIVDRQGRRFDAIVHTSKYDVGGSAFYAVVFQDMRESRERERLLFSRAEMFRLTIEQSPVPMSIQDQDWRFVLVNKAYCELVGYDESELLGRDPLDFLHSEAAKLEAPRQREALKRSNLDELPRFTSLREGRHRDGHPIHYQLELGYTRGIDGAPLWCSMLIDLSRINRAESDLDHQAAVARRLQTRFEAFANSSVEALLVADPSAGTVLYASPATATVFGIAPAEAMRDGLTAIWQGTGHDAQVALCAAYARSERDGHAECEVRLGNAATGERTVRVRFVRSDELAPEVFVLGEDVSEFRRLQQDRLDEAIAQREALIREIHHRIKNNLQGTAGLLQRAALRRPDCSELITDVADQIYSIAEVHGLIVGSDQRVSALALVRSVAEHLQVHFGRTIAVGEVGEPPPTPWLLPEAHSVPIALVVNEMLTNAIKHSPPDTKTEVAVQASPTGLRITVANVARPSAEPARLETPMPYGGVHMMRTLLPPRGADLSIGVDHGVVTAVLHLQPPAVVPRETGIAAPPERGR